MREPWSLRCRRCGAEYRMHEESVRTVMIPSCNCGSQRFVCEDENHYRVDQWAPEHFEHLDQGCVIGKEREAYANES